MIREKLKIYIPNEVRTAGSSRQDIARKPIDGTVSRSHCRRKEEKKKLEALERGSKSLFQFCSNVNVNFVFETTTPSQEKSRQIRFNRLRLLCKLILNRFIYSFFFSRNTTPSFTSLDQINI